MVGKLNVVLRIGILGGTVAFLICAVAASQRASGQFPEEAYTMFTPTAAATCAQVAPPTGQKVVYVHGFHVTNTSASSVYVQLFNSTATPAANATPLGAVSWLVTANNDRDVDIGNESWSFNSEFTACCSSVQGTFTAGAACGWAIQYR